MGSAWVMKATAAIAAVALVIVVQRNSSAAVTEIIRFVGFSCRHREKQGVAFLTATSQQYELICWGDVRPAFPVVRNLAMRMVTWYPNVGTVVGLKSMLWIGKQYRIAFFVENELYELCNLAQGNEIPFGPKDFSGINMPMEVRTAGEAGCFSKRPWDVWTYRSTRITDIDVQTAQLGSVFP